MIFYFLHVLLFDTMVLEKEYGRKKYFYHFLLIEREVFDMKKVTLLFVCAFIVVLFTACGKDFNEVKKEVDKYNSAVKEYNVKVSEYNESVQKVSEANKTLDDRLNSAQEIINKGEEPYKETTLTSLKDVLSKASSQRVDNPKSIETYEELSVDEKMNDDELEKIEKQAKDGVAKINKKEVPKLLSTPDYSNIIKNINKAEKKYQNSVKALKQVTAPEDKYVIQRLQTIKTIMGIQACTEEHDPNGKLHKSGGYIGCIYFLDKQVDRNELSIEPGEDIVDVGTDGGGAIEIYANTDDANKRNDYLANFDGSLLDSGSHSVIGTIVVRTSTELTATQQKKLEKKIIKVLTKVKE